MCDVHSGVNRDHVLPANHIVMIEGFDITGKSTFVKNKLGRYTLFECDHDLTDKTVGRHNSWTIGYGVVNFLEQVINDSYSTNLINLNAVINRGVFSSYVYPRLYGQRLLDVSIIDYYRDNKFFKNDIEHIYVRHHDVDTARFIFEESKKRALADNELSRQFDHFNSFDDYWVMYTRADLLFRDIYKSIGVKPRIFETMPDMTWVEVEE